MGYYAAFLDLGDKPCLVVGGGAAATEKAQQLLDAGASVTVLWTSFDPGLQELGDAGRVRLLQRELEEADLQGCCLVIDASGDDDSGARVAAAARRHSVLVNVLDRPALCDFIAPALVRRGPLQVAISTAGRSPFLAAHLRRLLEGVVGPEWGELVELTGRLRDRLRRNGVPLEDQNRIYRRIPDSGALELLRSGRHADAEAAVNAGAGESQPSLPLG